MQTEEEYPSLLERLQSSFIDTLIIILLMIVFSNMLDHFSNVPDWIRILMFAFVFIIYEPLFMTFGCTAGNYIKRIRVRKNDHPSQKINILQAVIRYPIKLALGWISFLTINSNYSRRAIHDLACGSVMIKV